MSASDTPQWGREEPFELTSEQQRAHEQRLSRIKELSWRQREGLSASGVRLRRATEQEHAQPVSSRDFTAAVDEYRRLAHAADEAYQRTEGPSDRYADSICHEVFFCEDEEFGLMDTLCGRPAGHAGEHGDESPGDDTSSLDQAWRDMNDAHARYEKAEAAREEAGQLVHDLQCNDKSLHELLGCPLRRGHPGPHQELSIYNSPSFSEYRRSEAGQ